MTEIYLYCVECDRKEPIEMKLENFAWKEQGHYDKLWKQEHGSYVEECPKCKMVYQCNIFIDNGEVKSIQIIRPKTRKMVIHINLWKDER